MAARRPQAGPSGRMQNQYASFNVVQLLKPLFKELGRLPASLVLEEINAVSMDDSEIVKSFSHEGTPLTKNYQFERDRDGRILIIRTSIAIFIKSELSWKHCSDARTTRKITSGRCAKTSGLGTELMT